MRGDREKLQDILEAIDRIDRYSVQGRKAFELRLTFILLGWALSKS